MKSVSPLRQVIRTEVSDCGEAPFRRRLQLEVDFSTVNIEIGINIRAAAVWSFAKIEELTHFSFSSIILRRHTGILSDI
jgi:hypothetical protein